MQLPVAFLAAWIGVLPPWGPGSAAESAAKASLAESATALAAPEPPGTPCASSEGIDYGPRLARWIEKRKAKCGQLAPYRPRFLERQILAFEKAERPAITQFNVFGFYPRAQTIEHRSQLAGGARFWRPEIVGTRFDASGSAFWSLQGFRFYDLQLGVVPHAGKAFPLFAIKSDDVFELANVRQDSETRYMLYGSFAYRWAPEFDFFGIGPDSRAEDRADFLLEDKVYEVVAGCRVLPRLTLSVRAGRYHAEIGPGRDAELPPIEQVFAASAVPGLATQPDFVRTGAAAVFDSRDVMENPHRGAVIAVQWLRHDGRGTSPAGFDRLGVDARGFLPLGHPQRLLALRAYASQDAPRAGGRVPFYMQSFLGSSHTLRGYLSQRFRGERLALFQAEYRWEAAPALELAAFFESGAVAATRHDALEGFRTDGGVGLRFKTHEAAQLRLDCVWGAEGFRFLFRLGPVY